MKKREIIIVICVIAFGVIYNAVESGDFEIRFYEGCSVNSRSLLDRRYPNDFPREERQYTYADIKKIEINNPAGEITVETFTDTGSGAGDGIRVKPLVRVYHRKANKAVKIDKKIDIVTSQKDEKLSITLKPGDDFPYRRVRVHFEIAIPGAVELDLLNRYGDIKIEGCGKNIALDVKHGDISVKQVDSNIKIRHRHGAVVLQGVEGKIDLYSRYSVIGVKDAGALKLDCSHARVTANGIRKETHIDYAAYSSIKMDGANDGVTIEGRHTKIKLGNINGGVKIKNSHDSITMEDIAGNINIGARHCRIRMAQVVSEGVVIKNSYANIDIEGITAKTLDILTVQGNVDIAVDGMEERINIKDRHARILLNYPPSMQPLFNINSEYGTIIDKTSVGYTILKEKQRQSLNTPEGKPEVIIDNPYGTTLLKNTREEPEKIEIKKVETEKFEEA